MGKKNKDKKGKGKEKTEQKTEKKAAKRAKKELAEKGEEDIEKMIAEFVEKDKQLTEVREVKCPPPSPRSNMTLVAHPDRDELIMFGGEYYTGKNMYLYNDLFFYNIRKNEWSSVSSPNPPPPRSAHQAVTVASGGGQMWIFGGEFASHSQNQFYHYRDLWVLHLRDKTWEQFKNPGKQGPTARSGHRMVAFKNQLIMFGGFHNNNRDCRYYNDLWTFDLSSYSWSQLEPVGMGPCPRSGCILCPTGSRVLVYGGYSMQKVKKDVDQGTAHTDMFALQPQGKGEDGKPAKWRWLPVKQSGTRPSARSSMSAVVAPGNHAVVFGGVEDEEEDEEQLEGTFFNDMFTLDVDKGHWYTVQLRGNKQTADKKRRRKVKQGEDADADGEDTMEVEEDDDSMDVAENTMENLALNSVPSGDGNPPEPQKPDSEASTSTGAEGGVFTLTVGPQSHEASGAQSSAAGGAGEGEKLFVPCPRMSPCLAVKAGVLYLYGGKYEVGDREITLSDFHSVDLSKLDVWKTIIAQSVKLQAWEDSDSESDEAKEGEDNKEKRGRKREAVDIDEDSDDDDDDDEELTFEDAPARQPEEAPEDYFERTQDYWLQQARDIMEGEGIKLSDRKLLKIAKEICEEALGKE